MTLQTSDNSKSNLSKPNSNSNSKSKSLRYPVVCIDGPSGAGKGTVAWRLAQALNYQLLDSGALYRIVGLKAYEAGLIPADTSKPIEEAAVLALTQSLDIVFVPNNDSGRVDILVNGKAVGEQVRNETIGSYASRVAIFPKVREALLTLQRDMAIHSGLIADGRDMGTVVFPDADVKVFLTASAEARAERRVNQLIKAGQSADYDAILTRIKARDDRDENRATAPSKPAKDALVIDSSALDANTVYEKVKRHCQSQGIFFNS